MIPDFNDDGHLSPGLHRATMEEIAERFGRESELRRVQVESLHWLIDLAKRADVQRIVLNGSFVTDAFEPNDVDCVLLIGEGTPQNAAARIELRNGLPFLEITLTDEPGFIYLVETYYATDRHGTPKGMIEVLT